MQSNDLTPEQASRIVAQVRPMLAYLRRLVKRMDKRRFTSDDPLLRVALKAQDAVHALHVEVHYLSCQSGAGRLPPEKEVRDKRWKSNDQWLSAGLTPTINRLKSQLGNPQHLLGAQLAL